MKCHYEVLDVARDADETTIKSAYKKLALRWHPDKNLNDPSTAKEQFQQVQQAYEVLGDRQERAWYDNHREEILFGSDVDYEDNCLNVFQYFTSSCYSGYADDENGFYSVYRNVFETIAKEEMEHMERKEEYCSIPMFGNKNSDYEQIVNPFYNFWLAYSTKKSYVWLDPFDIREGHRRVLKSIDKENKKVRAKAKKKRNEEVRNLVVFVRKRDQRVQAHTQLMEQQAKEHKKKLEERVKQARQAELENHIKEKQAEWSKFDNLKEQLEEIEKQLVDEDQDKDEEEDDLYCVACNKVFKTTKSFANHESSKKHKENVELIREEMLEDEENDEHLDLDDEIEDELSSEEEIIVEISKKKAKKKNKKVMIVSNEENHDLEETDKVEKQTEEVVKSSVKKSKRRKEKSKDVKENGIVLVQEQEIDVEHTCVTCKNQFSSKNKLFDHLKKTSHGVYIDKGRHSMSSKKIKGKSLKNGKLRNSKLNDDSC